MATSSYDSLSHAKWDCKYHVVFLPQRRKEALDGKSRRFLGPMQPTVLLRSASAYELPLWRRCGRVRRPMWLASSA